MPADVASGADIAGNNDHYERMALANADPARLQAINAVIETLARILDNQ